MVKIKAKQIMKMAVYTQCVFVKLFFFLLVVREDSPSFPGNRQSTIIKELYQLGLFNEHYYSNFIHCTNSDFLIG